MKKILEDEPYYVIPKFQREYSWEDEHVETFWSDLWSHFGNTDRSPYFFGTIVLIIDDEIDDKFKVVDGQQRLTTSLIFLSVIRDILQDLNRSTDVTNIHEYIELEEPIDPQYPYRLKLSRNNEDFFREHVLKKGSGKEKSEFNSSKVPKRNQNIAVAYKLLYNKIQSKIQPLDEIEQITTLIQLHSHFLKYFTVVRNVIDTPERAYRIFESINNRGIELIESDLVKNYLLEVIDHAKGDVDAWHDKWLEILARLDSANIKEDLFLRHYLIANYGPTDPTQIFEKISSQIRGSAQVEKLIESLYESADIYRKLKKAELSDWFNDQKIVDNLDAFDTLGAKVIYPVLLKGFKVFKEKKVFSELIEILLLFFFRSRTICKTSATALEKLMNQICKELRDNTAITIGDIKTILRKSDEYPTDPVFAFNFSVFDASSSNALYILVNLNAELHGGRKTMTLSAEKENISIEHIMPKVIKGTEWEKYFKTELGVTNPAELDDYHKNSLWKIGNLTILNKSKNFSQQNGPFKEKLQNAYKNDEAKITKQLENYPNWNADTISNRQKMLAETAKNIWKIEV